MGINCCDWKRGISWALTALARPGTLASIGRDASNSLISSIISMGVMPQIASGEKVLKR